MDEKTIITYQLESTSNQIEVRIEDETVWLNRNQMAIFLIEISKQLENILITHLKKS